MRTVSRKPCIRVLSQCPAVPQLSRPAPALCRKATSLPQARSTHHCRHHSDFGMKRPQLFADVGRIIKQGASNEQCDPLCSQLKFGSVLDNPKIRFAIVVGSAGFHWRQRFSLIFAPERRVEDVEWGCATTGAMPKVLSDLRTDDFSIATLAVPDSRFIAPKGVTNNAVVVWFRGASGQSVEISPRTRSARSRTRLSAFWRNTGPNTGHFPSSSATVCTIGRAVGFSGTLMLHPSPP